MKSQGMTVKKGITLLRETELFKGLNEGEIEKILNLCKEVRFKKNETVMREGEVGDELYIVIEGIVEVAKNLILEEPADDGNLSNKVFTKLKAEDHAVFGEMALLEESERTATITALTDCVFYKIKKFNFLKLAEADHELGYKILLNISRIVSSRLRKANEDIIKLTTALSIILKES